MADTLRRVIPPAFMTACWLVIAYEGLRVALAIWNGDLG